jgi:hypothetical protein
LIVTMMASSWLKDYGLKKGAGEQARL